MITGQYRNSIDEKARLLIPSRMRSEISGEVLIITAGLDNCLWVFPPEDWQQFSDKLMSIASPFSKKARLLQRRIIAPAQPVEIDKAGRILVPSVLKEGAGLQKECILNGIKRYIEIWDSERYASYLQENDKEFQMAAEELGGSVSFF